MATFAKISILLVSAETFGQHISYSNNSFAFLMPLSDSLCRYVDEHCLTLPSAEEKGRRVVIDTNVVLDLVFWQDEKAADLARLLQEGQLTAVRDRESMKELAEVASRPHFLGSEAKAGALVEDWCRRSLAADEAAVRVQDETLKVKCKDPLDQKFLSLTVASKAPLLITKDKLVLKAGKRLRRFGTLCVKPEEVSAALEILAARQTLID